MAIKDKKKLLDMAMASVKKNGAEFIPNNSTNNQPYDIKQGNASTAEMNRLTAPVTQVGTRMRSNLEGKEYKNFGARPVAQNTGSAGVSLAEANQREMGWKERSKINAQLIANAGNLEEQKLRNQAIIDSANISNRGAAERELLSGANRLKEQELANSGRIDAQNVANAGSLEEQKLRNQATVYSTNAATADSAADRTLKIQTEEAKKKESAIQAMTNPAEGSGEIPLTREEAENRYQLNQKLGEAKTPEARRQIMVEEKKRVAENDMKGMTPDQRLQYLSSDPELSQIYKDEIDAISNVATENKKGGLLSRIFGSR